MNANDVAILNSATAIFAALIASGADPTDPCTIANAVSLTKDLGASLKRNGFILKAKNTKISR